MACNMEVPLKLAFTRSGALVEHRRVRLASPTMASVRATVARQARGAYTLLYTDNEGDLVTMQDEEEWRECVALWHAGGAPCLLVRVERPGSSRVAAARGRSGSGSGTGSRRCSRSRSGPRRCARRHDGGEAAAAQAGCGGEAVEEAPATRAASLYRLFARRRSRSGGRRGAPRGCDVRRAPHAATEEAGEVPAAACGGLEACKGCDFAVTGVAKEHCCRKCESRPGKHGPRCAQRVVQRTADAAEEECIKAAETTSSVEDSAPEQVIGGTKCKGCDFAVTGVAREHCCWKCESRPGKHGPRCAQRRTADAAEEECVKAAETASSMEDTAPEQVTGGTCTGCDFAVTGVAKEHCCRKCARHPGRHGPRCLQRAASQAEAPCLAETSTKAVEGEASCVSGTTCKGCDFAVTGVAREHCCRKCESRPGKHGPRCAQRVVQRTADAAEEECVKAAETASSMEDTAPEQVTGGTCTGCDFAVTGVAKEHCCRKCARHPGRHGPRCLQRAASQAEAPCLAETSTKAVEGEASCVSGTTCKGCDFAVTGVAREHCCRKCESRPGKHGPRCAQRVVQRAAGAAEEECVKAAETTSSVEDSAPEQVIGGTKCKGCDFAVTGVAREHCCRKCESRPGKHGPRCAQRVVQRTADAAEECVKTEETVEATGVGEGAAPEQSSAEPKCKGCNTTFTATGPKNEYCCGKCARFPGRHTVQCRRMVFTAETVAVPPTRCGTCEYAATGAAAKHCCRKCARHPGKHFQCCPRRAMPEVAAEPAGAATETDAHARTLDEGSRVLGECLGVSEDEARVCLESTGGDVEAALQILLER